MDLNVLPSQRRRLATHIGLDARGSRSASRGMSVSAPNTSQRLTRPPFCCATQSFQAEVDVNTPVELSSLVSSTDLPLREGEERDKRERFYLTTAINYTNGEGCESESLTYSSVGQRSRASLVGSLCTIALRSASRTCVCRCTLLCMGRVYVGPLMYVYARCSCHIYTFDKRQSSSRKNKKIASFGRFTARHMSFFLI